MRSGMLILPQAREALPLRGGDQRRAGVRPHGGSGGRGKLRYAPSDCAEGARSISKHSRCVVNKTLDAKKHYAVDFHAAFAV